MSNKSSLFCILHVKNLRRMKRILDNLLIPWMLQRVFHVSAGPLQPLTYASLLSVKLSTIMNIVLFIRLWYYFFILESALEGGVFLDSSTISRRPTKTNIISNLNFQTLKFTLLNLLMTLVPLSSSDAIFSSKIENIHF